MPPIPGIRTSSTRQSALSSWFEAKNPSAEANEFTANPTDLSNPQRASRTDSSSSTTEISWTATQQDDHFLRQASIIRWYMWVGRVSPRPSQINSACLLFGRVESARECPGHSLTLGGLGDIPSYLS